MDEATQTEVIDSSSPAVEAPESGAVTAPGDVQGESQAQSSTEQPTGEAAAPFQIPENDDDLKGQETNPHVQAIVQLRQELRARNQSLDEYKPLDNWKPIVESVGDPQLAQSAYELVNALYTPSTENPSGFDPRPFLDQVETDSPGTINQLFSTICSYQIQDDKGNPTTVVRELYRAHGLDPDRIDDYRNIDNLRASGIVTTEDLAKIPEKYHEAFKSMSSAAREDLLDQMDSKPLVAEESLRNAQVALKALQYEQQQEQVKATETQQQEAQFKRQVETAVTEGVNSKISAWSNSIHQKLSSQWKPSTDETINEFEYAKVIGAIAALQQPAYRPIVEKALGADATKGFDELVNQWSTSYSAQIAYEQMGQQNSIPAKRAKAAADLAEQRILLKLGDFAKRLSEPTSTRTIQSSQQQATQLAAAQGRFVPTNGSGGNQQGFTNPYSQNPHPVGSPEYFAFNRKVDKDFQLTNASVFG